VTAKRGARCLAVASATWLLAIGAWAQEPVRPSQGRDSGGPQRMMPAEQRPEQLSPRDAMMPGRGNRMSPEERRQLRRDVHDAGRDLYPGRMAPARRELRRP
jgi:hypothetical protein